MEEGCTAGLSSVGIEYSVNVVQLLETKMIDDMRKLQDVTIPEGVEVIRAHWFYKSHIKSVEIPSSVRKIETEAFCECFYLERVRFASGSNLTEIGSDSFSGTEIKSIVIPKSVMTIRDGAFGYCSSLRSVVFEKGSRLQVLEGGCFRTTKMEEITIPRTLREASKWTFYFCDNLRTIWVERGCKVDFRKLVKDSVEVRYTQ